MKQLAHLVAAPACVLTLTFCTLGFLTSKAEARHLLCSEFFSPNPLCRDRFHSFDDFGNGGIFPHHVSCRRAGRWLRQEFFYRRVVERDCSGFTYSYIATRGRWDYLVRVDSRRLRIISERRIGRARR